MEMCVCVCVWRGVCVKGGTSNRHNTADTKGDRETKDEAHCAKITSHKNEL